MDIVDRIKELSNDNGHSLTTLEGILGLGNGTIGKWRKQSPSCNKVKLVADYLQVSIDYLVYGEETKQEIKPKEFELNQDEQRLLHMFSLLSDYERGEIMGELRCITKGRFDSSEENVG